jgi:hypothetical protein
MENKGNIAGLPEAGSDQPSLWDWYAVHALTAAAKIASPQLDGRPAPIAVAQAAAAVADCMLAERQKRVKAVQDTDKPIKSYHDGLV